MRKTAVCIGVFFFCFIFLKQEIISAQQIESVRQDYYIAINNHDEADKLYEKLKSKNTSNPLILAYLGSVQALRARFSWNPYRKLNYLSEGLSTLKSAIDKSPDNLEIRFLRFSLVYYLPGFLGYKDTLDSDRKKIVQLVQEKRLGLVNRSLLKNMVDFMKKSDCCTKRELNILESALSNG